MDDACVKDEKPPSKQESIENQDEKNVEKKPHHIQIPKPEKKPDPEDHEEQQCSVKAEPSRLEQFVAGHTFNMIMTSVLAVNMVMAICEIEWKGRNAAHNLGMAGGDPGWNAAEPFFRLADVFFNIAYLTELLLRVWLHRIEFFHHVVNWIDAVIICVCCVQSF